MDLGLPWPDTFGELLPVIREQWGVGDHLYLIRKLSGGRSGALVYAADIESAQFTGQAILKLDFAPDSAGQEAHEAGLHHRAMTDAPTFAAKHLPRLVHTLHHKQQIAVLSTIAGRGLQYAKPWINCTFDQQIGTARELSRALLEEWNDDYRRQKGMGEPRQLLKSWLGYRLDPQQGGRIHRFLAERCALTPDVPSVTFEGQWYPNPVTFASDEQEVPEKLRLRMITGRCHGDLHGMNVLVGGPRSAEQSYWLIDLAFYQDRQYLFYDHAYFEAAHLLNSRMNAGAADWEVILAHLSGIHDRRNAHDLHSDDIGLIDLVRAWRQEVSEWIDRREAERLVYMESQFLLARVAAGLNFVHKQAPDELRRLAFIYAAANLKEYLQLNQVEWPKHGPPFSLEQDHRSAHGEPEPVVADEGTPQLAHRSSKPGSERSPPQGSNATGRGGLGGFVRELSRRNVIRVAGLYLVVAWACVQIAATLESALSLPSWTDTLVVVLLAIGFPFACMVAWAFELNSGGLRRSQPPPAAGPHTPPANRTVDFVIAAGIVAVFVFVVGQRLFDTLAGGGRPPATASGPPSIAVLPFKNLSTDQGNDSFSDGLTVEIMGTLDRTGEFRVAGQSSTFKYKDRAEDPRIIGQDLGVAYILEGSVRRIADDIRVEAQLIEADDGFLVWSNAFSDEIEDLFVIQEKIANSIGTAMKIPLGVDADRLETNRTHDPDAYSLFLRAVGIASGRDDGSGSEVLRAIDLLRESVKIDPEFAAGWGALSLAYDFGSSLPPRTSGDSTGSVGYIRQAAAAALKAQSLDPKLAIVQHAMANVHIRAREWVAAEDEYRAALEQEPNSVLVLLDYARLLAIVGHDERALAMVAQAGHIDPHHPLYEFSRLLYAWRKDPGIANAEALLEDFPKQAIFDPFILRSTMGYFLETEQSDKLLTLLRDCDHCDPSWRDPAISMIKDVGTASPTEIFNKYRDNRAMGYSFLSFLDGAKLIIDAFEYYSKDTTFNYPLYLVPWAEIDQVGASARFQEIIEAINVDDYWRERGWPNRCRPLEGSAFECS
ncbi:MAG: hypothetical protein AAFX81_06480 [Pseudomonadota bacterium]